MKFTTRFLLRTLAPILLPALVTCSNSAKSDDDYLYADAVRDRTNLSQRTVEETLKPSRAGPPVHFGDMTLNLPTNIQITSGPNRENGAYFLEFKNAAAPNEVFRIVYSAGPMRGTGYPNSRLEELDNGRTKNYIPDISTFANRFSTDLDFYHTIFSLTPSDVLHNAKWTPSEIKGMLLARPIQRFPAVEATCPGATFIHDRPDGNAHLLVGWAFDTHGNLRGLTFLRTVSKNDAPNMGDLYDHIFASSTFDPPQTTKKLTSFVRPPRL